LPFGLNLLAGPSGSGKTIFCQQYAFETLKQGGKVVWVTTEELPSTLREEMARFGWNISGYEKENKLVFYDAASPARLGFTENSGSGTLGLDPTGMLIVLTDQLRAAQAGGAGRPENFALILDSLSRLLLSCDYRAVIDFVACLSSRLESFRVRGFATACEGAHDIVALNALSFSCVGTIRFRILDSETRTKQFRIETLRGRSHDDAWKNYAISGTGIDVEM
jgi:KaiC/GvpD/RAD55 family RecA-like ATPase